MRDGTDSQGQIKEFSVEGAQRLLEGKRTALGSPHTGPVSEKKGGCAAVSAKIREGAPSESTLDSVTAFMTIRDKQGPRGGCFRQKPWKPTGFSEEIMLNQPLSVFQPL